MSSGNFLRSAHPHLFQWNDRCHRGDYLFARYRVTSGFDGPATAIAMAMEQSAATTYIRDHVTPEMLAEATIRVVGVAAVREAADAAVTPFHLATEVYHGQAPTQARQEWAVELAIPHRLLHGKPAQLFNVVIGELPRLGFLTSFRLDACELPSALGPGSGFGVEGIRDALSRPRGPILCRSMRPAVGLDQATMARLNYEVLGGGFHLVKDDELQSFPDNRAFREHVVAMLAARDRARAETGERKGYLANLICEPDELAERWQIVNELGVDAVLVAPYIQGFGTLASLARQRRLPILAHNTCGDLISRHPEWGIADEVLAAIQARCGADWFVTPGDFGAAGSRAFDRTKLPAGERRPMPILQGGKTPEGVDEYRAAVGSDDFMLIVASWVDSHPDGVAAGARVFRNAVDRVPAN